MPALPSAINLGHIAKRAKVSRTTVSLALRDSPRISERVRKRVQALVRTLDYRPNPLVNAHMAYVRTLHPHYTGQCIAFVCNRSREQMEADTQTALRKYFHACQDRARALGYELELFNLAEPGMTERRLSSIMAARGVGGVIVHPFTEGAGLTELRLDLGPFAVVMIEHAFIKPRLHTVCMNEFSTIGRLIQRLSDYGYARIGIAMHSRMDDHANHYWLAGYQAYQALNTRRNSIPHFITSAFDKERFLAWRERWHPDAIITVDEDIVLWLRAAGIKVPEEVGCATIYWREDRPHLSGFYQNHEAVARAAVELVAAQLCHNERGLPAEQKTVLVEAVWKEGATLFRKTPPGTASSLRVWTR